MRLSVQKIFDDFSELFDFIHGDNEFTFEGLSSVDHPQAGTLVFVSKPDNLESLNAIKDIALVFDKRTFDQVATEIKVNATLVTKKPLNICLAKVSQRHFEKKLSRFDSGIHPKAIIHDTAEIHDDAKVGPGAIISQGVKIDEGTWIGANAFIGPNTSIGKNTDIYPNVYVAEDSEIGNNVVIQANVTVGADGFGFASDQNFNHHKIPQVGRVVIEDDVEIGPNSTIDRAAFDETRIKRGTKTDSQVHIAHNCEIGENCLLTGTFAVAGSTKIGDRCVFGGRVSVGDHIEVADDVQVGALSGVTKSITESGVYAGFPVLPISDFRRVSSSLSHLPQMRRDISRLLRGKKDE